MDDYGTGYSNMQALFSMNFNVIKIDKSILWEAEKSELGMTILESSISMLKQMGMDVLVEGVETQYQVDLLREMDCDVAQGFFFDRPLLVEEFEKRMGNNT